MTLCTRNSHENKILCVCVCVFVKSHVMCMSLSHELMHVLHVYVCMFFLCGVFVCVFMCVYVCVSSGLAR